MVTRILSHFQRFHGSSCALPRPLGSLSMVERSGVKAHLQAPVEGKREGGWRQGERLHVRMAEAMLKDPFPDVRELESKVGRRTPESLLSWMRDAAERGDVPPRADVADGGAHGSAPRDSISAKINHLKNELRWLRSADVRILCQLASVNEGIEAMRWLMGDLGAPASRGSSLTGSLSSLVTLGEHGWTSPSSDSPSPISPQDLTVTAEEEPERLDPPLGADGDLNLLSPNTTGPSLLRPSRSKYGASWSTHEGTAQPSPEPACELIDASLKESQSQDPEVVRSPAKYIRTSAKTIKRALLRSSRVRREVTADTCSSIFTNQSAQGVEVVEDHSQPSVEEGLLHNEAQWDWMGSQDDITFL